MEITLRVSRGTDLEIRPPGSNPQYSRSVTTPGCGTGYFPSGPGSSGAGESVVSLSTSGANSCS